MKRFKGRKRKNNSQFFICLAFFLISISMSLFFLYKNNLIQNDSLATIIINDNFKAYQKKFTSIDFLLKYALDIDLIKDTLASVVEEETPPLDIPLNKEEEPLVYIYNTHQEEKYESPYLGA